MVRIAGVPVEIGVGTLIGNPFRFMKSGVVKAISLVDPSDLYATPIHSKVGGIVNAWEKSPIDTYVVTRSNNSSLANENFSRWLGGGILLATPNENGSNVSLFRSFLKVPPNKTLFIYAYNYDNYFPIVEISVKEVDPAAFDIGTITWNNQPALGSTIATFTPTSSVVYYPGGDIFRQDARWYSIPTGTTGAICLKCTIENNSIDASGGRFSSSRNYDSAFRPYIT